MRTGRPFGDLCCGAPAEGAGRFPLVVADTPLPVPSPAETEAGDDTPEEYYMTFQCSSERVRLWKVYLLSVCLKKTMIPLISVH